MTEIAPFLFGLFLNGRKFTRGHFPAVARGLWRQAPKWQADLVHEERFRLLAVAITDSAIKTMGDLDKLVLAREVLRTKLVENFHRDTTLSKLIELFVEHPLVTVELAARRLRLTPQAIEYQIKMLGTAMPHEMTGRKRYRAWGI